MTKQTPTIEHYNGCSPDYPEKPIPEAPGRITEMDCEDFIVYQCVDCGAFVTVDKDNGEANSHGI